MNIFIDIFIVFFIIGSESFTLQEKGSDNVLYQKRKPKKREPINDEHLELARHIVEDMEKDISNQMRELTRSEIVGKRNKEVRELRFPSSLANRTAFATLCGKSLLDFSERQRHMMLRADQTPPTAVLAVFSPLASEGLADWAKQVGCHSFFPTSLPSPSESPVC